MMRVFVLTSPAFEGEVTFKYDFNGYLKAFENNAGMSEKQIEYLLGHLPLSEPDLWEMKKSSQTISIKELKLELTFEMFWNAYGYKEDKQEAEKVWNKLSDKEKQEAYDYIPTYKAKLAASSLGKKYPKTYLRQKPWIR